MTTAITLENTEIKQMDWSAFLMGVLVGGTAATILWLTILWRPY